MTEPLVLPRHLVQQLFHHAQSEPEAEVCGLIGRNGQNLHLHRMRNAASTPASLFAMDDGELTATMKRMREAGETLFAIYHSHPSAPAEPSARDLAEAGYPDAWQLIISLNTKGVLELRAWRLDQDRALEAPLRIIED